MNLRNKCISAGLAFLTVFAASAHAEYGLIVSLKNQDPATGASTGLKVKSAQDNPASYEPASVTFLNVPNLPVDAADIQVTITYRDARGTAYQTTTNLFDAGCYAEQTDEGVNAVCPVLTDPQ